MRLRIALFHRLSVRVLGGPTLKVPESCRPLLSYLILQDEPVPRTETADLLWPDREPARARRCLSTALWRLNQLPASDPLVVATTSELEFNRLLPHWIDVASFQHKLRAALAPAASLGLPALRRLERGLRLYTGDILGDIEEEWAYLARQRLRDLYLSGLLTASEGYAAIGEHAHALVFGKRLSILEPLREDVHRLLMRQYMAIGARAKAIEQYRICEGELGTELGIEPMEETKSLYHELVAIPERRRLPPRAARVEAALTAAKSRIAAARRALVSTDSDLNESLTLIDRAIASDPQEGLS
jgi:DNA-binding SARP family transcriptional activator